MVKRSGSALTWASLLNLILIQILLRLKIAEHYNKDLLASMAKEAQLHIDKFSQQNLANLAWAYGKLSYYDSKLMDSVAFQSTARVKVISFKLQDSRLLQ